LKVYLNGFSNAPLRVRIALALKGLCAEEVVVDIEPDDWARRTPELASLNPQQMLPVLIDGSHVIPQSLAIIEYLEEKHPLPRLLPPDAAGRARVRALALLIACDGQPLLNLRVRKYLEAEFSHNDAEKWFRHWMQLSLREYEASLARVAMGGRYSYGDYPTLADVCLVPQMLMAQRFNMPTDDYPRCKRVFEACMEMPVFAAVAGGATQTRKMGSVPI
jgi:maleylpyruvate isomerase